MTLITGSEESTTAETGSTVLTNEVSESTAMDKTQEEGSQDQKTVVTSEVEEGAENKEEGSKDSKEEATLTLDTYKDLVLPENAVAPEGWIEGIKQFALDNNLTAEQANAVLGEQLNSNAQIAEFIAQKSMDDLNARVKEWEHEIKSDSSFVELAADARRGLTMIGEVDPELKKSVTEVLEVTKLGSHPAIVAMIGHFGKMLKEPDAVKGKVVSSSGTSNKSAASVLFPSHNKD